MHNHMILPLSLYAPDALQIELPWPTPNLLIDNYSKGGWVYVPLANRYVPPGRLGQIVTIPATQMIEVVWQSPPVWAGEIPTNGDLAVVTIYSQALLPFSNKLYRFVPPP